MTTISTSSSMKDDLKPESRVPVPAQAESSDICGDAEQTASLSSLPREKSGPWRSAHNSDDSFSRLFGHASFASTQKPKSSSNVNPRVDTHTNLFGHYTDHKPDSTRQTDKGATHKRIFGHFGASGGEDSVSQHALKNRRGFFNPITGADYKDMTPANKVSSEKEVSHLQREQPSWLHAEAEINSKQEKIQDEHAVVNPPRGRSHNLW